MKTLSLRCTVSAMSLLITTLTAIAQESDKSLYPYFQILSEHATTDSLPLKSAATDVLIAGVIADVTITQTYQNTGDTPIEAIYVFPGSTRAAVYDMEMKIGDRLTKALVKEKGKARQEYVTAKKMGKRASLLEQNRPNVFTMNVANILPGDEIEIVLKYTETNMPEEGRYTFIYPGVVGPRFTEEKPLTQQITGMVPYAQKDEKPLYEFDITASLSAGMPIQDITSTSHEIDITYAGLGAASVTLAVSETNGSNRDFILQYQLAGEHIDTGLLLYDSEEEDHFMLTVQPPKRIIAEEIPRREYIFVVDVSGSMSGFPTRVTKKLMRNLLTNLTDEDRFNVMLFASNASVFAETSVRAEEDQIEAAIRFLDYRGGGSGTMLMNALQRVVGLPRCDATMSRSVVVVTDGYVSVEKEAFDLIRNHSNEFNFYAFGIGSSVNRFLIEGIAHVGGSEPLVITSIEDAQEKAEQFRQYISTPVLTDIEIDWAGMDVYDLEPATFVDVFAERPIVISGKYKGQPSGIIKVSGESGVGAYTALYNTSYATPSVDNKAIKYLWAREKIRMLDDYNKIDKDQQRINQVIDLGLKYNLLTSYTSFIAIDHEVTYAASPNKKKKNRTVRQALPLPKGVSQAAIGQTVHIAQATGADLTISNGSGDLGLTTIQYDIIGKGLTEVELLFLELEFAKILKELSVDLDITALSGLSCDIRISENGKILTAIPTKEIDRNQYIKVIMQQLKGQQLIFKKGEAITINIKFN